MIYQNLKHFTLIASLLLGLSACMPRTLTEHQQSVETHVVSNPEVKTTQFIQNNYPIEYRYRESSGEAIFVYIHGTPGNWKSLAHFLIDPKLDPLTALRISIDRPGWGESSSSLATAATLSLAAQSERVTAFLANLRQQHPQAPIILVGHSYGATLVTRLLMDSPESADAAMLLAGPVDPNLAAPRWYHRLANTWLIKKVLGNELNKANIEMNALQADLSAMLPFWQSIQVPVTVILGQDDKLVNHAHGDFMEQQLASEQLRLIRLEDQGHFIPWQQHELIRQELQLLLSNLSTQNL